MKPWGRARGGRECTAIVREGYSDRLETMGRERRSRANEWFLDEQLSQCIVRSDTTGWWIMSKGTTRIGYVNEKGQEVIRATDRPGTDYGQRIYILRCRNCGHEYGANGSDIWQRRCPKHDGGAEGL